MTIDLPSGRYKLFIRHDPPGTPLNDLHGRPLKARTYAMLFCPEGDELRHIATTFANCSAADQFKKKVGVRLAVTRLIRGFPRPERALIWKRVWNLK